jgi:hypothetical protein
VRTDFLSVLTFSGLGRRGKNDFSHTHIVQRLILATTSKHIIDV